MDQGSTYDITISQGARYIERFQWLEDDGTTPIPLTARTLYGQVRRGQSTSSTLFADFEFNIVDADEGTFDAIIPPSVTAAIKVDGFYDILLVNNTDPEDVVKFVGGKAILDGGVTEVTTG